MLVLSRRSGEKIMIGDDVTITVVDIDRGRIRLGITAPKSVPVYRSELTPAAVDVLKAAAAKASNATCTPAVDAGGA